MTRKKQGAPQKLNAVDGYISDTDLNTAKKSPTCTNSNTTKKADFADNTDIADTEKTDNIDMDSSCEKLLAFTKSFLPPSSKIHPSKQSGENKSRSYVESRKSPTNEEGIKRKSSQSPTLSSRTNGHNPFSFHNNNNHSSSELELLTRSLHLLASKENLPNLMGNNKEDMNGDPTDMDLSSLSATQKFLVDAMLRQQRQYYDQCSTSWMSVQRPDNNCLSKSKAERYRWCVQGGSETSGNHKPARPSTNGQPAHVITNPKKSNLNHSNNEGNSTQEKLFSQVFSGASKFHCRDCRKSFNTLVDLTVHMNKTGHFRDTNDDKRNATDSETPLPKTNESISPTNAGKIKKRPTLEEEPHSEKVLTCMGCGNLFESLQDLSVHMIKTKHYENVPALRMWSQKQDAENQVTSSHGHVTGGDSASKKRTGSGCWYKKNAEPEKPPAFDVSALSAPFNFSKMAASDIFGFGNPAAAAASYASLLYTAPWLASSFLPQLMYPYAFTIPYATPLVSMPTAENSEARKVWCTECKREFSTLTRLAEHIRETQHFPTSFGDVTIPKMTSEKRHSVENAQPRPYHRHSISSHHKDSNNSCNSSTSVGSPSPSPPSESSYLQPPDSKEEKNQKKAGSFDFIKSLESTIQSAISKVESPHSNKTLSQNSKLHFNNNNSFTPFSSSIKQEKKVRPLDLNTDCCQGNKNKRTYEEPKELRNGFKRLKTEPSSASHNKSEKSRDRDRVNGLTSSTTKNHVTAKQHTGDGPLDLTVKVKKTDLGSPKAQVNSLYSPNSTASDTQPKRADTTKQSDILRLKSFCAAQANLDPFLAYSGSVPSKDPLQSLKDNMQSFFSFMGNQGERQSTFLTSSAGKSFSKGKEADSKRDDYKPLMIDTSPTSDRATSNPLREMLKIVNSADLEEAARPPPLLFPDTSVLRKRSLEEKRTEEHKKGKFSLLHDLVIPREHPSCLNPLQKMQDLVDRSVSPTSLLVTSRSSLNSHRSSSVTSSTHFDVTGSSYNNFTSKPEINKTVITSPTSSRKSKSMTSQIFSENLKSMTSPNCGKNSPPGKEVLSTKNDHRSLEINAASSLLSLKQSRRHSNGEMKSRNKKNEEFSELEKVEDLTTSQEIQLQLSVVQSMTSQSIDLSTFEISQSEIDRLVNLTELKEGTIKAWFRNQKTTFHLWGGLSFLRCQDDQQNGPITFQCLACRHDTSFSCVDDFTAHLRKHLGSEYKISDTDSPQRDSADDVTKSMTSKDLSSPLDNEKLNFQSAMCYSSYLPTCAEVSPRTPAENQPSIDDVTSSTPPPSDENPDDDNDVVALDKVRHHARSCPVGDDVIGVTG